MSKRKQRLREQLKRGAIANAELDLETAAAWFPLEEGSVGDLCKPS